MFLFVFGFWDEFAQFDLELFHVWVKVKSTDIFGEGSEQVEDVIMVGFEEVT